MADLPPDPTQVRLISPRAARAQKVLATVVGVGVLVGGTITVVHSDTWWEVVLWVAASLLVVLIAVSIGASAAEDARASAAGRSGAVLDVLVGPAPRTWAVVH
ncbi:hypothetical protein ACFV4N_24605 [Actinosynnema sp. NPDC059797]